MISIEGGNSSTPEEISPKIQTLANEVGGIIDTIPGLLSFQRRQLQERFAARLGASTPIHEIIDRADAFDQLSATVHDELGIGEADQDPDGFIDEIIENLQGEPEANRTVEAVLSFLGVNIFQLSAQERTALELEIKRFGVTDFDIDAFFVRQGKSRHYGHREGINDTMNAWGNK